MKKSYLMLLGLGLSTVSAFGQYTEWDGTPILQDFYGRKISDNGVHIVAESPDGSTISYNIETGNHTYYDGIYFGKGNCVADNGWIVGCEQNDYGTWAVIMKDLDLYYPEEFDKLYAGGNIHGITPDASRVCGVVNNAGSGMTNFPFYSDIDDTGNIVKLNILPYPSKDLMNGEPQYITANWISNDGKTIAGQVVDGRGFLVYPILYKEDENGEWSYSLPSESLFNPQKREIPEAPGELEDYYPDLVYPNPTDYMTPDEIERWEQALLDWETSGYDDDMDPYANLDVFMTPDELDAYLEVEENYWDAVIEYNEMYNAYSDLYFDVLDESVVFTRNALTLSGNGEWLAASANRDGADYCPYLFDLVNGEIKKIGIENLNLHTNQVFDDGKVLSNTIASMSEIPVRSYIYLPEEGETVEVESFIASLNAANGEWMDEYLTGEVPVGIETDGSFIYKTITVTGLVATTSDFSVIMGGVDGYALEKDMYFTYILRGDNTGVGSINAETPADGIYRVYNLQGVNVLNTKDANAVSNLPQGLYIVNGKKLINAR